ncbi:CheR family methyltransferase [Silvibacterium sp.]|uniref:CheR family methyltransferase n=1 Tax=Silvibacterium sp. TaxID=1964179 RepID=UPI0039E2F7A4
MIESHPQVEAKGSVPQRAAISKDNYSFLQRHVYANSGIVIDASKEYLIDSRLMPLVRVEKLKSLDELCQHIRGNATSPLSRRVVEAMTTNETLFFRDAITFEALKKHVLPRLLAAARAAGRKLTIWSAAASTGQEAYSLAITLLEMGVDGSEVKMLGTDLSEQVLERARKGRYLQLEVNRGLPAAMLLKYFRQVGLEWEIDDRVRRMVTFEPFDLRQRIRNHGPFDLVLCRNVLIYFDVETKRGILDQVHAVLRKQGILVLGVAETIINVHNGFTGEALDGATVYLAK